MSSMLLLLLYILKIVHWSSELGQGHVGREMVEIGYDLN